MASCARALTLAGALGLTACAGPSEILPSGWDAVISLAPTLTAETNRQLAPSSDPASDDILLTQALNAGLVLTSETERRLLTGELGLTAAYFEGSDRRAGTGRLDPRASIGAVVRRSGLELSANASVDLSSTDQTQEDDTGITDVNATQITGSQELGLFYRFNPRHAMNLELSNRTITFDEDIDGLSPTRTIGASAEWDHALSEISTLTYASGLRFFASDNDTTTRSQVLDLSVSLSSDRTPRHTVRLGGGVSLVRTGQSVAGVRDQDFDLGFTGNVGFDYRLSAISAGFDFNQSVEPSNAGELQAFSRASGRMSYEINDRESLSASASYTRRSPLSGDDDTLDTFSIGPNYALALDRQTDLSVGYLFRMERDDDGTGLGHRVFLSLEHRLD